MKNFSTLAICLVAGALMVSCGGGGTAQVPPPTPPQPAITLTVLPADIRVVGGGTAVAKVYAKYASDGLSAKNISVTFTSADNNLEIGSPLAKTDNQGIAVTFVRAPSVAFHDFTLLVKAGNESTSIPIHTGPRWVESVPNATTGEHIAVGAENSVYSNGTPMSRFAADGTLLANFSSVEQFLTFGGSYNFTVGANDTIFVDADEFGVVLSPDGHHIRTLPYDVFTGPVYGQQSSQIAPDGSVWFHYNGSLFSLYPNSGQSFGVGSGTYTPLRLFKFNSKGNVVAIKGMDGSEYTIEEMTTSATSVRSRALTVVQPRELLLDENDHVYIVDTGVLPYRMVMLDETFNSLGQIDNVKLGVTVDKSGQLVNGPADPSWEHYDKPRQALATEDGGYVLVYPGGSRTVRSGQKPTPFIAVPPTHGWLPVATTISSAKELYTLFPGFIQVSSLAGDLLRTIPYPSGLGYAADIDRDEVDTKYVLDSGNRQVLTYDRNDSFIKAVLLQDATISPMDRVMAFKDGSAFVITGPELFTVYELDGRKRWSHSFQSCLMIDASNRVHAMTADKKVTIFAADGSPTEFYEGGCPFYSDNSRLYMWNGALQVMTTE